MSSFYRTLIELSLKAALKDCRIDRKRVKSVLPFKARLQVKSFREKMGDSND